MKFPRILVPVDGDDSDREAIELACRLAKEAKGKVCVVHVIQVPRSLALDAELETETKMAEEVLLHAETIAHELDCEVETDILQTREVGPAVVDEAMERSADLIVMGMGYRQRFGQCRVWVLRQALLSEHNQ
ncbi:MAG: universal stress protein [Chloroflexi bacterium]|nr:universal stress protein [Chloroflexota bacterium]